MPDCVKHLCDSLDQVHSLAFGENIVSWLRRAKSWISRDSRQVTSKRGMLALGLISQLLKSCSVPRLSWGIQRSEAQSEQI